MNQQHLSSLQSVLEKYQRTFYAFKEGDDISLCSFEDSVDPKLSSEIENLEFPVKIYLWGHEYQSILEENRFSLQLITASRFLLEIDQLVILDYEISYPYHGYSISKTSSSHVVVPNIPSSLRWGILFKFDNVEDGFNQFFQTFGFKSLFYITPSSLPYTLHCFLQQKSYVQNVCTILICGLTKIPSKSLHPQFQKADSPKTASDFSFIWGFYDSEEIGFFSDFPENLDKYDYNEKFVVYTEDGKPASQGMFTKHDKIAGFKSFFTLEEYRSRGYGSILLSNLIQVAKLQNCETAYLVASNHRNRKLYERYGFSAIGFSHYFSPSNEYSLDAHISE